MAILSGFPPSNTISASVRITEQDLSFITPQQSTHAAGLVGFASKGPIDLPTAIGSINQLHTIFGYGHPDVGDPYMIYAAEQYLLVANQLFLVRVAETDAVSDESAVTASVDVPVAGSAIVLQSATAGPYVFGTDSFFNWKLNGISASKTLHVPAGTYSCTQLVALLNSQLVPSVDGIQFGKTSDMLNVSTIFAFGPDSSLELVSVQNAIYGKKTGDSGYAHILTGVTGLGRGMLAGISTGSTDGYSTGYVVSGTWDFTSLSNLQLLVVVDGTNNVNIDNAVQVIDLADLEGISNSTADIVNEINSQITAGTIPGGFFAVGGGVTTGPTVDSIVLDLSTNALMNADNVTLQTLSQGRDAKLLVKSQSTAAAIFGFSGITAVGTSPSGASGDVGIANDAIATGAAVADTLSFTLTADSAGIEGNNTQVVIINNVQQANFEIDVYTNGVQVESWGHLTKDQSSTYYVSTYLSLVSDYIRATDNTDTAAPPQNGTYALAGGNDGIPSDPEVQDSLLIGSDLGFTGLFALSEPEQIDIDLLAVPGHSSTAVVLAMIEVCQSYRQDCLAIIDPPFGLTVREIINWQNGVHPLNTTLLDSDFAALYWPWVKIYDAYNQVNVWVPPSGSVMAVMAQSDNLSAPWFAPAGLKRGHVPGITDVYNRPTLEERDLMYGNSNAINPIIQFSDLGGFYVWGQKTLQRTPTALDRVNVRRLMFTAEKQVKSASRNLLFDPNDDTFQQQFVSIVTQILREIQVGRGLYDFIILADSTLNTPDVVARNEFRAQIGIQPTYAVEFMFIEFSVNQQGSFALPANTAF